MVLVSEWYPSSNKFICDYVDSLKVPVVNIEPNNNNIIEKVSSGSSISKFSGNNVPQNTSNHSFIRNLSDPPLELESKPPLNITSVVPPSNDSDFKHIQDYVKYSIRALDKIPDNQRKIDEVHDFLTELNTMEQRPDTLRAMNRKINLLKANLWNAATGERLQSSGNSNDNLTKFNIKKNKIKKIKKNKKKLKLNNDSEMDIQMIYKNNDKMGKAISKEKLVNMHKLMKRKIKK